MHPLIQLILVKKNIKLQDKNIQFYENCKLFTI